MARTGVLAVRQILGEDYDGRRNLLPFIETASVLVTRIAACAEARDEALSAAELELIERWLACHFYGQSDKPLGSKSTKGASGSYHGQTAMYLESTLYGQTAVSLDASGCLADLAEGRAASAGGFWLGKPPSEQTDYRDRD